METCSLTPSSHQQHICLHGVHKSSFVSESVCHTTVLVTAGGGKPDRITASYFVLCALSIMLQVPLSFVCWLRKLLAARQVAESMMFIVGGSSVVFNKVEFVHMWEKQLVYLIATCQTLMGDFPLGFREVIPDQTVPEKWKELTLNTGQVHVSHTVLNLQFV